jgi:hypothetical protein
MMGIWRKKIFLRFGVQVFWREPVNHENDCYLCMKRTKGVGCSFNILVASPMEICCFEKRMSQR